MSCEFVKVSEVSSDILLSSFEKKFRRCFSLKKNFAFKSFDRSGLFCLDNSQAKGTSLGKILMVDNLRKHKKLIVD